MRPYLLSLSAAMVSDTRARVAARERTPVDTTTLDTGVDTTTVSRSVFGTPGFTGPAPVYRLYPPLTWLCGALCRRLYEPGEVNPGTETE